MKNAREMLKRHEGFSNVVYKDTAEPPKTTICWGHNCDANPLPKDIEGYLAANGNVTPDMCERLLDADIQNAVANCRKLYPKFDTFSDNRQDALIDFVFNVGIGSARKFLHANFYINSQEWGSAADEMEDSNWYKETASRAVEVVELVRNG